MPYSQIDAEFHQIIITSTTDCRTKEIEFKGHPENTIAACVIPPKQNSVKYALEIELIVTNITVLLALYD